MALIIMKTGSVINSWLRPYLKPATSALLIILCSSCSVMNTTIIENDVIVHKTENITIAEPDEFIVETRCPGTTSGNSAQTSNIKHQTSNIKHPTSNIKHQTPNIKHPTSNIKHPTSNIKHQTSNIKHYFFSSSCSINASTFVLVCSSETSLMSFRSPFMVRLGMPVIFSRRWGMP